MAKDYSKLSKEELLKLVAKQDTELDLKSYGIIRDREKKPEQVVLDCENNLPILERITNKEIKTNENDDCSSANRYSPHELLKNRKLLTMEEESAIMLHKV